MRSAGILQKLQPRSDMEEQQRKGVKNDLASVNLGDATPLLVMWGASVLICACLLILERKTRRMVTRRSYVTVQANLHTL
jgi:beta-lactamase regulating signal transducer with metallopeptidase domain